MRATTRVALALVAASCFSGCAHRSNSAPQPSAKQPSKRPPRRPGVPRKLGQAELEDAIAAAKRGDLDLTIQRCEGAIAKNPRLEHAYLLLGSACAMKSDLKCERAAYERGLAALPRSAAIERELGLWHLGQGNIPESVEHYERANALAGGEAPEFMADLAYAYIFADRASDAASLAQRALGMNGQCFTCAISLGQAMLALKRFEESASAYRTALDIDPDSMDALHGLAKADFLAGRLDASSKAYARLLGARPDDFRLRVQAAQVDMARGAFTDATEKLISVAEANPGQAGLLELLLEAQSKSGDKAGAAKTKKALDQLGR